MARFRFHRGGFQESLETEIRVESLEELKDKINSSDNFGFCKVDGLSCRFYGNDGRPEGYPKTYVVLAEIKGMVDHHPVGFSDELLR